MHPKGYAVVPSAYIAWLPIVQPYSDETMA